MGYIRSLLNYDAVNDIFRPMFNNDHHYVAMEDVRRLDPLTHRVFERFLSTVDPVWTADRTMILILMAVALFNPTRTLQPLHQASLIRNEHEAYKGLLFKWGNF